MVLSEAIKRLRDSEGKKVVILWRGLKNMNLEHDSDFLARGRRGNEPHEYLVPAQNGPRRRAPDSLAETLPHPRPVLHQQPLVPPSPLPVTKSSRQVGAPNVAARFDGTVAHEYPAW